MLQVLVISHTQYLISNTYQVAALIILLVIALKPLPVVTAGVVATNKAVVTTGLTRNATLAVVVATLLGM